MKNHMVPDIIEQTYDSICRIYGIESAIRFSDLIRSSNGGSDLNLEQVNPSEQIRIMNTFWRKHSSNVPNGTIIRTWLCEGSDISIYINAFECNWIKDIHIAGLI